MPVDLDRFRSIAASFPTGVTVVTAVGEDGEPRGLASNAFASVSASPPLVLVCVDKGSRTLAAIQRAGAFVVNFLSSDAEAVARKFASKDADKFAGVAWRPSARAGGAPILTERTVAHAECLVEQAIEAGDHWIFIGRVEDGTAPDGRPLLYFKRRYGAPPPELA
ncbi:MAG TPA: flavin reductase family protein [Candidatus Limnocylindrales bacterium]|nr:flavin reductase family protein [Candidatus Limnocylindrales bacterium]